MQEIKKRRIVLASVLKPVNDIRMFEKLGITLSELYEVHIIGFPARTNVTKDIYFYPLHVFNRLSLRRLLAPWTILARVCRIRPHIFIITTHELLLPGVLAKWITGCKLIYDVQENYYRNIRYQDGFPLPIRPILAWWVKLKESLLKPFVDHYLLAERAYQAEMSFPPGRFTIIENKLKKPPSLPRDHQDKSIIRLLFSGTLSESTGVFTAIALADALHHIDPRIRLTIIGYAPLNLTYERIHDITRDKNFVTLIGGDKLVPHHDVMHAIAAANFGIISYPPNPSTENSIPTKLYEYLGSKLPILLINNATWVNRCAPYPAAVVFDAHQLDAKTLLKMMSETVFYRSEPDDVYWQSEADRLLDSGPIKSLTVVS
jgi:hypothetical protein